MKMPNYKSKCCGAKVKVGGIPDFLGSKEVITLNFSCCECGKPCDVVQPKGRKRVLHAAKKSGIKTIWGGKRRLSAAKKRIQKQEKRLDFQGKTLQKLVEFLDGITISPTKGVILTTKKKRQLAELKKMEQQLSKAKKSH